MINILLILLLTLLLVNIILTLKAGKKEDNIQQIEIKNSVATVIQN